MSKQRVVLTGAMGYVAQRMFAELAERWELVPTDISPTTHQGRTVPGVMVADLTQPDRDQYRQHFRGADAVIYCGYVRALGLDATTWQSNSEGQVLGRAPELGPRLQRVLDGAGGRHPTRGRRQLEPRRRLLRVEILPSKNALAAAFAPDNPCGFTLTSPARHVQAAMGCTAPCCEPLRQDAAARGGGRQRRGQGMAASGGVRPG